MSDHPSIADQFVFVMGEIAKIEEGIDNDHPHRYPIRRMRDAANQQIEFALRGALLIADSARALKKELQDAQK